LVSAAFADPTVAPSGSVYLRASFDADGRPFVGRFVPSDAKSVDETLAMPTACSSFVTWRQVDGGGVKYSELFQVSDSVAVDYVLTGKLVADIADPAGFAKCCADQPGQCTDRYVGAVLQGTGTVYRERTTGTDVGASGVDPVHGVTAGVSVSHGTSWEQAITFDQPVFFAFELTQNPYRRVTSAASCGTWVDRLPTDPSGRYFLGASKPSKSEAQAKSRALRDAWRQVVYAGFSQLAPGTVEAMTPEQMSAASMQAAGSVETREWCVERTADQRSVAKVLGYVADR
jgi:hypothetical protein